MAAPTIPSSQMIPLPTRSNFARNTASGPVRIRCPSITQEFLGGIDCVLRLFNPYQNRNAANAHIIAPVVKAMSLRSPINLVRARTGLLSINSEI